MEEKVDAWRETIKTTETHFRDEVVAASDQKSLGRVVSPAEKWTDGDPGGVGPENQEESECHSWSYLLTRKSLME